MTLMYSLRHSLAVTYVITFKFKQPILNGLILRYSLIPRFDITFLERNTLELVKN